MGLGNCQRDFENKFREILLDARDLGFESYKSCKIIVLPLCFTFFIILKSLHQLIIIIIIITKTVSHKNHPSDDTQAPSTLYSNERQKRSALARSFWTVEI
jgi:hypothetical protein